VREVLRQHQQQVVQHIPRLRRYARALLNNADVAEDLVQETLARALGKLHAWRRGSDMRAWLFAIMHNLHVNANVRAGKRPDAQSLDDGLIEALPGTGYAEQQAQLQDIEMALTRLPELQRAVILLVSLEGLSYAETARVLGVKQGTVMSRLHRARENLRSIMQLDADTQVKPMRRVK
jgi:RNA polymerase sigma-70 factor (ECF subfamily)